MDLPETLPISKLITESIERLNLLPQMPIRGGNPPNERIVKKDVFALKVIRQTDTFYDRWLIRGEAWFTHRFEGKPELKEVYVSIDKSHTSLEQLEFMFGSGLIPAEFWGEA